MSESERHELEDRLVSALAEITELRAENERLRGLVSHLPASEARPEQPGAALEGPRLDAQAPEEDKVRIFRGLFRGREDVYAYRWEGRDGRSGYSPALRPGARRQKGERPNPELLLPLNDDAIRGHLLGHRIVGIYPLLEDETCWFLAIDFDKASWQIDVAEVMRSCRELRVPASLERSRSGHGAHLWIFFERPLSAHTARNLGCAILTDALERRHQIGFESYDRLFPSQDTMPQGRLRQPDRVAAAALCSLGWKHGLPRRRLPALSGPVAVPVISVSPVSRRLRADCSGGLSRGQDPRGRRPVVRNRGRRARAVAPPALPA